MSVAAGASTWRRQRRALTGALASLLVLTSLVSAADLAEPIIASADASPAPATSAYVAVPATRLLDTRLGGAGAPGPGAVETIDVADALGSSMPAEPVVAAAVTITAVDAPAPGYVTAWGDGPRPSTSVLNLDASGQTRSNFAIVPLGVDGSLSVSSYAGGHVVVDLSGVFVGATAATGGRLVVVPSARAVDTRVDRRPLVPREIRPIDLAPSGVPPTAIAAVVSITGIGPSGWITAWRPGDAWPGTSTVTIDDPFTPTTATAIVPIRSAQLLLTSLRGGDVVLDVIGYLTGDDAPSSTEGLFVPVAPTRVYDSRDPLDGGRPLAAGTTITRRLPWSDAASALAATVTVVDSSDAGFVTAFRPRSQRPTTASMTVAAGQTLATGTIVPSSPNGTSLYTLGTTHLVVDVTGWFVAGAGSSTDVEETTPSPDTSPTTSGAGAPTGAYRFSMVNADGSHARWDPCSTIRVLVNLDGAPTGARAVLDTVLAQARTATGLRFSVESTTSRDPRHEDGTLTVLWRTPAEQPQFGTGVLGLGGAAFAGQRITAGWVHLAAEDRSGSRLFDTMLHELGHALGLAHVDDAEQVMYPKLNRFGTYQAGDRAGLRLLGAEQGCIGPVAGRGAADVVRPIAPMIETVVELT